MDVAVSTIGKVVVATDCVVVAFAIEIVIKVVVAVEVAVVVDVTT